MSSRTRQQLRQRHPLRHPASACSPAPVFVFLRSLSRHSSWTSRPRHRPHAGAQACSRAHIEPHRRIRPLAALCCPFLPHCQRVQQLALFPQCSLFVANNCTSSFEHPTYQHHHFYLQTLFAFALVDVGRSLVSASRRGRGPASQLMTASRSHENQMWNSVWA